MVMARPKIFGHFHAGLIPMVAPARLNLSIASDIMQVSKRAKLATSPSDIVCVPPLNENEFVANALCHDREESRMP
jgi:hypothetical protein